MRRRTTTLVITCAAGAAVAAFTVAATTVGDDNDDKPLTGDTLDQATKAALDHVGEGTVVETETGDDGAAYGVEIELEDGSQVEVNLDEDFNVTGEEADDDGNGDDD